MTTWSAYNIYLLRSEGLEQWKKNNLLFSYVDPNLFFFRPRFKTMLDTKNTHTFVLVAISSSPVIDSSSANTCCLSLSHLKYNFQRNTLHFTHQFQHFTFSENYRGPIIHLETLPTDPVHTSKLQSKACQANSLVSIDEFIILSAPYKHNKMKKTFCTI